MDPIYAYLYMIHFESHFAVCAIYSETTVGNSHQVVPPIEVGVDAGVCAPGRSQQKD